MADVLQVRGLRKRYGEVRALKGLDLDVRAGEVFGFLGPNGAGKTTFTKCVTGFVRPDGGEVLVAGIDAIAHPTKAAPHIGLVPDQYDFYPNLTGRQHLDFYARLLGLDARARRHRIDEVLAVVRMEERADTRTKGYSHGMKQRICIAQAILHEPELILFDEPTNGLDPQGAHELREMMRGLAKSGATVFLNSHLLSEVEQTCERVAILDHGELRAVGPVRQLVQEAGRGALTQVRLLNPTARLAAQVGKRLGIPLRMEGEHLTFAGDEDTTARVVAALVEAGAKVVGVASQANLEAAFLQLVGGEAA